MDASTFELNLCNLVPSCQTRKLYPVVRARILHASPAIPGLTSRPSKKLEIDFLAVTEWLFNLVRGRKGLTWQFYRAFRRPQLPLAALSCPL